MAERSSARASADIFIASRSPRAADLPAAGAELAFGERQQVADVDLVAAVVADHHGDDNVRVLDLVEDFARVPARDLFGLEADDAEGDSAVASDCVAVPGLDVLCLHGGPLVLVGLASPRAGVEPAYGRPRGASVSRGS